MAFRKILSLILIICIVVGITGCGTLDMMVGLKKNETNPDVNKIADITDLEIVTDSLEDESKEEAIETITVTTNTKMKEIVAYYEDDNGFIVPVHTEIPWEEGIAKATLRALVKGNQTEKRISQSGLHGVLPENTEIKGMSIKDGLCRIDFSKQILNTQSYEQEQNMMSAITYTLTEFPTINKVEILVEGQALASLPKGYEINTAFEREDINLFGSKDGVNYTVYYKAPDTEVEGYYIPLTFSAEKVISPVKTVVQKLFDGPPADTELSNRIPYGVNLKNVNVSGDTAVIDLGVGAVNMSEKEYKEMHKIVVLCLQQFGIENVEYKIEGLAFEEAGLNFEESDVVPVFNEY